METGRGQQYVEHSERSVDNKPKGQIEELLRSYETIQKDKNGSL